MTLSDWRGVERMRVTPEMLRRCRRIAAEMAAYAAAARERLAALDEGDDPEPAETA